MDSKNKTTDNEYKVISLTFFKDWHELAKKYNLTEQQYGAVVYAMCEYCFYDKDTQLDNYEGMMFEMSKPSINKSKERKIAGHFGGSKGKGGAPPKNDNAHKKKA